ncbi:MAG TPA: nucleotide sugar dehydrogenase [Croceibacterium sp.]
MRNLPPSFKDKSLQILGLGYVGLTLAVAMAEAGFRVHGIEVNPAVLSALSQHRAHFTEYGLNDRLARQMEKGQFTVASPADEAPPASVFIVTVGTPVGEDKRTRFTALNSVIDRIAETMPDEALVILRSTVRVGTTNEIVRPVLEATGKRFDLAFCPERTLEGKALAELATLPQVVGGIDDHSTFRAAQLFSFLTPTIIRVRNAETAEMVKLVNNTHRDLQFAFANEIAGICDSLGISAHEVIASGNIGYARSAMPMPMPGPVGGPCLEKDPYILAEGVEGRGFSPGLALAGRKWNEGLPERSVRQMCERLAQGGDLPKRVAILGLAFKGRPETDDLRGTMAVPLIEALRQEMEGVEIVGWDAMVDAAGIESLGIAASDTAVNAARGAGLVIFQNNHPEIEKLNLRALAREMAAPGMIYDFWNQHGLTDSLDLAPGIHYAALGGLNLGNGSKSGTA